MKFFNKGIEKRINKLGIKTGIGLRQGMPISPYFSNIMLFEFDKAIESQGIKMVRYADDLIAFGDSQQECIEIHNLCSELLLKEGLHIHPLGESDKTLIASPSETIEFLGLGLSSEDNGYELIVTGQQLGAIRQKVLCLSDLDYCIKNKINISKLTQRLEAISSGYRGAYQICKNIEQLQATIDSAKSLAMTKLFIKEFKIDFDSLTAKQKQFLTIS